VGPSSASPRRKQLHVGPGELRFERNELDAAAESLRASLELVAVKD